MPDLDHLLLCLRLLGPAETCSAPNTPVPLYQPTDSYACWPNVTWLWTIPGLVQAPPQHIVRSCAAQAAAGQRNGRAQVVRGQEAQDAAQQLRRHVLERAAHGASQLRRSMHAAALGGRSTILLQKGTKGFRQLGGCTQC